MASRQSEQSLGSRLRRARDVAGLSVRQLEVQSGVHRSTIHRLEADALGSTSPGTLSKLAQTLELDPAELFALAEMPLPAELITLPAMLRAEYDLPPEAIAEMQRNLERIARRYRAASTTTNETNEGRNP